MLSFSALLGGLVRPASLLAESKDSLKPGAGLRTLSEAPHPSPSGIPSSPQLNWVGLSFVEEMKDEEALVPPSSREVSQLHEEPVGGEVLLWSSKRFTGALSLLPVAGRTLPLREVAFPSYST